MKYRPSAAEAQAEAEIQEIEGGQDAVLPEADADAEDTKPAAKDYGWADEGRYGWDEVLERTLRWPRYDEEGYDPTLVVEEGEPAWYASDDQEGEDEDEPRTPPALDDDERLMVREFARTLMDEDEELLEAAMPTTARYRHEWLLDLEQLHDEIDRMDAAARIYKLKYRLGWLEGRDPKAVKITHGIQERIGPFERWATMNVAKEALEQTRVRLVEAARVLREGLERLGWVEVDEMCLEHESDHGIYSKDAYKAKLSDGSSVLLTQSGLYAARLLEGRAKARMEGLLGRPSPAPCDAPAVVSAGAEMALRGATKRPVLTDIPNRLGKAEDKGKAKDKAKAKAKDKDKAKDREAHDAPRSAGPKRPSGERRVVVVVGSGSRSALPARADAFYRDQATRVRMEDAKRVLAALRDNGAAWGVADEALGWAEPDALMVPPDREPSEARKAELVTQTAQAIYRKALQAGARFVDILGPQGRYLDDLTRALTARGLDVAVVRERNNTPSNNAPSNNTSSNNTPNTSDPNPIGAHIMRGAWSPDPNVRMWGSREGDGGGSCSEPCQTGDHVGLLTEKVAALYMASGMSGPVSKVNAKGLVSAILAGTWSDLLNPSNKVSRGIYKTLTGISLPNGAKASVDAFKRAHHPDAELMLWRLTGSQVKLSGWCEVAFHGWLDDLKDDGAGLWRRPNHAWEREATMTLLRWAGLIDQRNQPTHISFPSHMIVPSDAPEALIRNVALLVSNAAESDGEDARRDAKDAYRGGRADTARMAKRAQGELIALSNALNGILIERQEEARKAVLRDALRVTYTHDNGNTDDYRVLGWSQCDNCGSPAARLKGETWTDRRVYQRCARTGAVVAVEIGGVTRKTKPCTDSPNDGWARLLAGLAPKGTAPKAPTPTVPRPPAHGGADEDAAIRAVVTAMDTNLSAGGVAQRIYQAAPYLRVEAPNAQELRIGPEGEALDLLLFPDGRAGRVWVHFDPDADPRHPGNEHLRRLPLQTLLSEHGAISDPRELAVHIITQMAHAPQEPGLHVAPGADVVLPSPKPQAPASVFTFGKHGWDWRPDAGVLFRIRRAAVGDKYIMELSWLHDDGMRDYSLGGFDSLQDAERVALVTARTVIDGYEPMVADGAWRQVGGRPVTEETLARWRKRKPVAVRQEDQASEMATQIWGQVVDGVARSHRDPERVRRVAASMQAKMVPQLALLLGEMVAKAKARQGGAL